jgi:hypothetical protein
MTRRGHAVKRLFAVVGVVNTVMLAAPGPALGLSRFRADAGQLGGYDVSAEASVVSVWLFEPVLPAPTEPQGEVDLAFTRSTSSTGPNSAATASWLWPGDTVGNGFGLLIGQPSQQYPVQVNSRYPGSPARQNQELTPGSGMTSSANSNSVKAGVNLADVDVPPSGSPGPPAVPGLPSAPLPSSRPTPGAPATPVPLPVSPGMAALVTAKAVTSTSEATASTNSASSAAHAAAGTIALLGGLITVDGVDVRSQASSNGAKGVTDGAVTVAGVTVAGTRLALDGQGLHLAGQGAPLPPVPPQVTDQLAALGIALSATPITRKAKGTSGVTEAQSLVITVDTKLLRSKLNALPLSTIVGLLPPDVQGELAPVLALAPKMVFVVGEAKAAANASPALPVDAGVGAGEIPGGVSAPGGATVPDVGTSGMARQGTPAAGSLPNSAGQPTVAKAAGWLLPAPGTIPRLLLIGALVLAAALGWALRRAGGVVVAGVRSCSHGLASGVPDLRKGKQ